MSDSENTNKVSSDSQAEPVVEEKQSDTPEEQPAVVKFNVKTGIKAGPCC